MSTARVQFSDSISFVTNVEIVRTIQAVLARLHSHDIGYQVRIGSGADDTEAGEFRTAVVLASRANPPTFYYPGSEVPDVAEAFVDVVEQYSSTAFHTGVVDLLTIRDAIENLNRGSD